MNCNTHCGLQLLKVYLNTSSYYITESSWPPLEMSIIILFLQIRELKLSIFVKRSNQSILKEINSEYSLEYSDAEAGAPILWPADAKSPLTGKDWRQKEQGAAEDEMVRQHHQLSGCESVQTPGDSGGQRSLACCSPWGWKESGTTKQQQKTRK